MLCGFAWGAWAAVLRQTPPAARRAPWCCWRTTAGVLADGCCTRLPPSRTQHSDSSVCVGLLPLPLQLGPQRTLRSRRVSGESAFRGLEHIERTRPCQCIDILDLWACGSLRIFEQDATINRPHEGWATSRHSLETRRPERKDTERGRTRHNASQAQRRNFRRGAGEETALDAR